LVLPYGLVHDHTDGHVDLVARFTDAGDVVACVTDQADEAQFARLEGNLRQLEVAVNDGLVDRVWPLPLPADRSLAGGVRPPRSYANFLAVPGGLLVPTFDDPRDTEALDLLQAAFPGREVVGVNATGLVAGGGALHCCSLLIPEGVAF
jgi:agmatine deiminase